MSSEGREQDLLDWIEDRLSGPQRAIVDAHLRGCGECRAAVREMQSLSAGLARLGSRRRVSVYRRWAPAAVAAAAVLVAMSLMLPAPNRPPDHGARVPTVPAAAGSGPQELLEVEAALRGGPPGRLQHHARSSAHASVRAVAVTAPIGKPGQLSAADLVALFESEDDQLVRLWLVVEIARTGDVTAADRIRSLVTATTRAPTDELLAAVEAYLRPDPRGRIDS